MIALVIWANEQIEQGVTDIRNKYDAPFTALAPHMTVLFPTPLEQPIEEVIAMLQRKLAQVSAFQLTIKQWKGYKSLQQQYPGEMLALQSKYPSLLNMIGLLAAEGEQEILGLRRDIGGGSLFPQPNEFLTFPPFMAIAHALTEPEYEEAMEELADYHPDYAMQVGAMDLIQLVDGKWGIVETFWLL